jgi:hypothetical protein
MAADVDCPTAICLKNPNGLDSFIRLFGQVEPT